MPVNGLTTQVGLRVGPIVLETLVNHYFDRFKRNQEGQTQLKSDELLYHEAFNIVKAFLDAASNHTVEEVQGFSNTPTPSPPWVRVVRVLVPKTCCDKAAEYLITALGGEEIARRTVGGVKWWQVRGLEGVDSQWITAKKDWKEAKKRYKMQEKEKDKPVDDSMRESGEEATYEPNMDEMRCILYSHGGGYYFGSVDQERYSIQRHARKINGRVFAINYRLAPQYPFPCALQDLVASYIYLIDPPPGAKHRPVNPVHIVVAGDSAGGGLTLALLQVIRDTPGLPLPAGGILISPWCDLTHSFPSIHTNTATDVIPPYGLSLQKPSLLWPPPSDDVTHRVQTSLRSRIREALKLDDTTYDPTVTTLSERQPSSGPQSPMPIDVGNTTPVPSAFDDHRGASECIRLKAHNGDMLEVDSQVQLYAPNSLLTHPLISPVVSYLGGLPPLMFVVSNGEVLRDEIVYAAHRAQYPDRFPIGDDTRALYPPLKNIESRCSPTQVHIQVYDDTAHVLPVLFSFTTPAKFCFRSMATFTKHVTNIPNLGPASPIQTSFSLGNMNLRRNSVRGMNLRKKGSINSSTTGQSNADTIDSSELAEELDQNGELPAGSQRRPRRRSSIQAVRRSLSVLVNKASQPGDSPKKTPRMKMQRSASVPPGESPISPISVLEAPPKLAETRRDSDQSSGVDVGGSRFRSSPSPMRIADEKLAGDPSIYEDKVPWQHGMIRERVSTQGIIRPLEPELDLPAFTVPPDMVGKLSELAVRRYLEGKAKFDKKYARAAKQVERERIQNLQRAKKGTIRQIGQLRKSHMAHTQEKEQRATDKENGLLTVDGVHDDGDENSPLFSSGSWSLAWALEGDERPPPSSIVARRDTQEAQRLAKIADQNIMHPETGMSANQLWSEVVNFLTATPDKQGTSSRKRTKSLGALSSKKSPPRSGTGVGNRDESAAVKDEPRLSRFSRFINSRTNMNAMNHTAK